MSDADLALEKTESTEPVYEDLEMLENEGFEFSLPAGDTNLEGVKIEPEVVIFKEEPIGDESATEADHDPILYPSAAEECCLFCHNAPQQESIPGHESTRTKKIEFVLNTKMQTSGVPCCSSCWSTFQSFYKFKRSCLAALSKRVEAMKVKIDIKTELEGGSSGEVVEPKDDDRADLAQKTCKICFRKFKTFQTLRLHIMNHREPKHFCEKCGEKFFYTKDYKKHSTECFVDKLLESTVPSSDLLVPKIQFQDQQAGVQEAEPSCKHCNRPFPKEALKAHRQQCEQRPPRRSLKNIQCAHCPKRFAREASYQLHLNFHNGIRTVQCRNEGCTKMFTIGKRRYEHEKNCIKPQNVHICPICGAQLRTDKTLREHVRKHRDPRFECALCEKRFKTNDELKKHTAVHTGERKFQCQTCGKRFKSYEANRVHQRIHTQETPYACTVCGQQFRYNCLLKTHMAKGH